MKLTWLFFVVIFACLMLPGCKSAEHEKITTQELPEIAVTATQAQRILVSNPIEVIGTVHSMHRSEIAAKVTGTISELPVILGSFVNKGDLLVTISAGEIDAQVKKSEAQLKQAIRNLERERKLLKKMPQLLNLYDLTKIHWQLPKPLSTKQRPCRDIRTYVHRSTAESPAKMPIEATWLHPAKFCCILKMNHSYR